MPTMGRWGWAMKRYHTYALLLLGDDEAKVELANNPVVHLAKYEEAQAEIDKRDELLQKAFQNTVQMLIKEVKVADE